jgi:diguanylate cyclase (GGDEF)-like protein/PAS domain S-box-containing protein
MRKARNHRRAGDVLRRWDTLRAKAKSHDAVKTELIAADRGREPGRIETEDRYRIIVETASEGVWTIDQEHRTTFVNRALAEMFGYEPQELLGKSVFDLLEPAAVEVSQRSLALRREGVSERLERPFRAKDGHTVWALMSTSTLHDSGGEDVGTLAMVTDITERKATEVERAHLAAIVDSSADSIISMTTDGTIRSWNEASSRLYGYSTTEALGQRASSLLARDPSERVQLLARAVAGEDQQQVESQDVSKDGRVIDVSLTDSAVRGSEGAIIGVSRIARDIGARKRMERELRHLAEHDWLTGLYNRRRLIPELDRCIAYARRYQRSGAVLMLDIDNFKLVNDNEGHDAGDRALKSVAEVLTRRARDTDIVAGLGGDEFAIVLPEATEEQALKFALDIRSLLCERAIGPPIYASIGISLFTPEQEITAGDALIAADIAQYEAKEHGGDQARIFDLRTAGTLKWVEQIRSALAEDRFVLFGQPIVDLRSDLVVGHELLIRMLSEDGEIIAPADFLPTAERFGLIGEIDCWVTQHALRLAFDKRVTINLAGPSIGNERILGLVSEAIADGLNPDNVVFEITETAAVSNFEKAEFFADRLNDIGCKLALDDFGTGFGSFTYLKHLNARYLKIDVDFVRDLVVNKTDQTVVKAVVEIAHSLDKKAIAEGVEDAATLTALKDRGVDFAQGFYLGRPERLSPPHVSRNKARRKARLPQPAQKAESRRGHTAGAG